MGNKSRGLNAGKALVRRRKSGRSHDILYIQKVRKLKGEAAVVEDKLAEEAVQTT